MKVVIVYKEASEHGREVREYLRDFSRRTGKVIEERDPYSIEGESFCRAYDVVEYPTMLALTDDGQVQHMWRGAPLPRIDEVSYYAEA